MKKILLATNNPHKVKEIKDILKIKGLKILSLLDFNEKFNVKENGKTFKENAVKKARVAAKKFGLISVADDSGLCVKALNARPGVRSARYVRPPVTSQRLCAKLLKEMEGKPNRRAFFVCSVAISFPDGKVKTVEGRCYGRISEIIKGSKGFGYDPVFIPDGYSKTFAEVSRSQKNKLSHRGRAFGGLIAVKAIRDAQNKF